MRGKDLVPHSRKYTSIACELYIKRPQPLSCGVVRPRLFTLAEPFAYLPWFRVRVSGLEFGDRDTTLSPTCKDVLAQKSFKCYSGSGRGSRAIRGLGLGFCLPRSIKASPSPGES